jgi:predicted kinase
MRQALLINGPPASGKTSLGLRLASLLTLPFLSRDTVKEPLFDVLGTPDRETNRALGRASLEIIWSVIADFPDEVNVIVEAWFGAPPYDDVMAGLRRARIGGVAELWCHAPGDVLAARYAERVGQRHPGHPDASYAPELALLAPQVAAMGIGPVFAVDTSDLARVDVQEIGRWVTAELKLAQRSVHTE